MWLKCTELAVCVCARENGDGLPHAYSNIYKVDTRLCDLCFIVRWCWLAEISRDFSSVVLKLYCFAVGHLEKFSMYTITNTILILEW